MKYFHIDAKSKHRTQWSPFPMGEAVTVGDKINPIYNNWMNSATRVGAGIEGRDVMQSAAVMLRELAFENLRARMYSALPSRTSCIWLCDSEESAEYWIERIPHVGEKRILEVEILQGKPHRAYEQHLTNQLENIRELEARAHEYWSGRGSGQREILFQGLLRVVRQVNT